MRTPIMLEQSSGGEDGFANLYAVELLYETAPALCREDLLTALRENGAQVDSMGKGASGPFLFAYPGHRVAYSNGAVPAQTLIDHLSSPPDPAKLEQPLQQSRDWPKGENVRSVVARCTSAVLVSDFMASGLAYKERLALIHGAVCAVMKVAPCAAIHWRPSQRIISPQLYLESRAEADTCYPIINIRLFNIANREEGDTVMDSLGLAALGIPDVQCHFHGIDLNAMAAVIYNSAHYLFENGDVIEDGNTIQGLTPDQRWRCHHEDAIVGPSRVVLDLDPGPPYAAGDRD